jgi:hypothetical protein
MKDIIITILFYLIWNTPIHQAHPTLISILLILISIIWVTELIIGFLKK